MNKTLQDFSEKIYHYQNLIYHYDFETYSHCQKVAHLSLLITKLLGLTEHEKLITYYASLIHDLGKIELPLDLIRTKGKLNSEQWKLIKEHPARGAEILRRDKGAYVEEVSDLILYHHEQIDGGGYPYGLKGDTIPLCVKIIAIADAMDAMLTYRPYRQGIKNMQQTLTEIVDKAGTQFDFIIARKVAAVFSFREQI